MWEGRVPRVKEVQEAIERGLPNVLGQRDRILIRVTHCIAIFCDDLPK